MNDYRLRDSILNKIAMSLIKDDDPISRNTRTAFQYAVDGNKSMMEFMLNELNREARAMSAPNPLLELLGLSMNPEHTWEAIGRIALAEIICDEFLKPHPIYNRTPKQ